MGVAAGGSEDGGGGEASCRGRWRGLALRGSVGFVGSCVTLQKKEKYDYLLAKSCKVEQCAEVFFPVFCAGDDNGITSQSARTYRKCEGFMCHRARGVGSCDLNVAHAVCCSIKKFTMKQTYFNRMLFLHADRWISSICSMYREQTDRKLPTVHLKLAIPPEHYEVCALGACTRVPPTTYVRRRRQQQQQQQQW